MSENTMSDKVVEDDQTQPETSEKTKKKSRIKGRKPNKQTERIKELEAKLAEAEDKILRIRAEYDNYRKRSYRELSDARAYAKTDALTPILTVYDHFKMAVAAAETTDNMKSILDGLKMINSDFVKAMDELGVEEINAVGEKFDPNLHEAVAEESSDQEEGTILKQWQCGYRIGGKLLRPATVVVSSGQPEDES